MGLDSYLSYYKPYENESEEIYANLVDEKRQSYELLYWRKDWVVVEWFCNQLNIEIENCRDYKIDQEIIINLLYALEHDEIMYEFEDEIEEMKKNKHKDIILLRTIIANKDFKKMKFVFSNWW